GAETGAQQLVHSLNIGLDYGSLAAGDAPTDSPSGRGIVFREASEGNDGDVRRDRGHGYVWIVLHDEFVVDFVGEDDQVVLASEFGNLFEHGARANGARGIVGIDEDDAAGAWRDLLANVVQIGLPAVFFIQIISVETDVELGQNGRVERIVGAGREQVVAGIEERGEADVDGLADAGGDKYILNCGDAFARGLAADGIERGLDARRRRVSVLAVAHGLVDGFDHVRGCGEIEVERIADVQRQDLVALASDLVGNAGQVANGIANIFEAGGRGDFAKLSQWHGEILIARRRKF